MIKSHPADRSVPDSPDASSDCSRQSEAERDATLSGGASAVTRKRLPYFPFYPHDWPADTVEAAVIQSTIMSSILLTVFDKGDTL